MQPANLLSHSLPLGETHAQAAVRAQERVGERIEVRADFFNGLLDYRRGERRTFELICY
jgi:hypothetical protein